MLSTGQLLQEFRIGGTVEGCEGEAMKIESFVQRQVLGRKVQGIAAALLPFKEDGRIAVEAFQNQLRATHHAGLINAVNMDTGYVNYLNDSEKGDVLRWTREALGKDVQFVGGAYIEGQTGDIETLPEADGRHCFTWWNSDRVPDEPAARKILRGEGFHVCGHVPRISACARVRAGANVRAERRDF